VSVFVLLYQYASTFVPVTHVSTCLAPALVDCIADAVAAARHRQHTSVHVSIRQHTPAYASIRQHCIADAVAAARHRQLVSVFVILYY
jgi:hypothetical protein